MRQKEEEVRKKEVKQVEKEKEVKQVEEKEEVVKEKRSYAEVAASAVNQSAHSRPLKNSRAGSSSDRQLRASTSANTKTVWTEGLRDADH